MRQVERLNNGLRINHCSALANAGEKTRKKKATQRQPERLMLNYAASDWLSTIGLPLTSTSSRSNVNSSTRTDSLRFSL